MRKVVAIIQARMGSTRLPGKILKKVQGKSLLEIQIERLKQSTLIQQIVVATTTLEQDNVVVDLCKQLNVDFFRGSEKDVLARYYRAAVIFKADVIVRLTSDCPLIDPRIVDEVIKTYLRKQGSVDYVSNTFERTFPRGLDAEVFSTEVLEKAYNKAMLQSEREHVTSYIYSNPDMFRIDYIKGKQDYSNFRWTVDTKEDFELIECILNELYKANKLFYMDDIIQLLTLYPEWNDINAHIEQKSHRA